MPRYKTGSIFAFKIKEDLITYFQYVGRDEYQMKSDCIVFFNYRGKSFDGSVDLDVLLSSGMWYVALTWITPGVRAGYYKKVYDADLVLDPDKITFKTKIGFYHDNRVPPGEMKTWFLRKFNSPERKSHATKEEMEAADPNAWYEEVSPTASLAQDILKRIEEKS